MRRIAFALLMLAAAPPAFGQGPSSPIPVALPEPARLAAARRLIDVVLPPAKRDAMMRGMIEPSIANIRKSFETSPQFSKLLSDDPRATALLKAFIERQMRSSTDMVLASMPALSEAMASAYARRFSVAQLDEVTAFYRTPTGAAFIEQMPTLMADADIQRVQREMMTSALSRVSDDAQALAAELAKLELTPQQGRRP